MKSSTEGGNCPRCNKECYPIPAAADNEWFLETGIQDFERLVGLPGQRITEQYYCPDCKVVF